jgi:hypothetical protein
MLGGTAAGLSVPAGIRGTTARRVSFSRRLRRK